MSHLPPNKGTKVLSAAVVMAILGSSSAFAMLTRVEPTGNYIENVLDNARHTAKGEYIHGDRKTEVDPSELWATSEPKTGKDEGTSTDKLYAALKEMGLSTDKKIIVAVIDSGADITHEDLQGHVWTNPGETGLDANGHDKATNGIDDDGDGFIDDVHGWNFIGAVKDGKNVNARDNTLEVAREYGRVKKQVEAGTLSAEDTYYKTLKAAYSVAQMRFPPACTRLDFNASDLIGDKPEELQAVCASESMKGAKNCVKTSYGNNDVSGRDETGHVMDSHATHVSGIIAAVRDNVGSDGKPLGIQGQATNVEIMSVRAVPGCDERDKDIANAIRFAVDHGAKVVNMSFGKTFSPHKDWVDSAVKYAESKGVLLVHAAGNEHADNDKSRAMKPGLDGNFPNQFHFDVKGSPTDVAKNWIEVGASTRAMGSSLPASFSNYGTNSVDLFAPGQEIMSSVPGNQYESESGTSMASPETAGVAALLMSIFPEANYQDIRNAMVEHTTQYEGLQARKPGTTSQVSFSTLSISGGIVNAYQAAKALKADRDARSAPPAQPQAAAPAPGAPAANTTTQTSAPTKQKTQSTVQSTEARKSPKHRNWLARVFGW